MNSNKYDFIPHRFYYVMNIVMTVMIIYGFSHSIGRILINPPHPNPAILYVHMIVSTTWLTLALIQTMLIQNQQINLHRILGTASIALGVIIPIVNVSVTIIMTRFHAREGYAGDDREMIFPLSDVVHFIFLYWLAIRWRRRPDFHKRLMFLTAVSFTRAAFFRYPFFLHPELWILFGEDLLMLAGAGRDFFIEKRVHKVYLLGLPILAALQIFEHIMSRSNWWKVIADKIVG